MHDHSKSKLPSILGMNSRKRAGKRKRQAARLCVSLFSVVLLVMVSAIPVSAAAPPGGGDPLATINNLSNFIFGAIRAIGVILLGFGLVQIGLSLKSHDASQRANGFMTFFGGIIIAFAKNILDLILA